MSNAPKEPSQDVLDYIKTHFSYRDGMIDGMMKQDIGSIHYRGKNKKPYMRINFFHKGEHYKIYRSHLVYFLCTGFWPYLEVDHDDRNTLNDKFDNLRCATKEEQQKNKDNYRYGFEVDRRKSGWYRARSKITGVSLGTYRTREEAKEAIVKYLEEKGLLKGGKSVG